MRNPPPRQWTNSTFGRLLGTGVGLVWIGCGVAVAAERTTWPLAQRVLTSTFLVGADALVIIAFWTSRLEVCDGALVSRHFYGTRSLPLASVVDAEPALYLGLSIQASDGSRMRSLVSGGAWNEFWKTRAAVICEQIVRLADDARRQ